VKRLSIFLACVIMVGCVQRWVDAPPPTNEGAFLVHVVKTPDESLPKILTWYTGTTLSQQLVVKVNPFLLQRPIRVGDKIVIPMEVVANPNSFGTAPEQQGGKVPNLLMGEGGPSPRMTGKQEKVADPEPQKEVTDLPTINLETFNDDTNPDAASPEGVPQRPQESDRVKQLEKEIAEKQRELQSLQGAPHGRQPGDPDMPPPGLLQEYEGS
jgi:hypothetical protein